MGENLKTTKYNDGSVIANAINNSEWANLKTGAYCVFNNDLSNLAIYVALYNWFTIIDNRKICSTGWHVPSNTEWTILTNYLGGEAIAGGKMKEIGTSHLDSPNSGADNYSGFTALGASLRDERGVFVNPKQYAYFWTSTENNSMRAINLKSCDSNASTSLNANDKLDGFSVRCLNDN
jgi:uncharacterized protein (TIGR02145 family)